jgi:hypothetical protein
VKFVVPKRDLTFEIPDEWWILAGMVGFKADLQHYNTDLTYKELVSIQEIIPPLREGGVIWFRDRDTVIELLQGMRNNEKIPPIEVSFETKNLKIHDGFHRFYLSIAVGYTDIPIRERFDFETFFANETRGT